MFDFSQVAPPSPSPFFPPHPLFSPTRENSRFTSITRSFCHFTSPTFFPFLPSRSLTLHQPAGPPVCLSASPSFLSLSLSLSSPLSGLPALPHTSSSSSFHFQIRVSRAPRRSASSHCILHAPGNNKSSALLLLLLLCVLHFVSALPSCTKEMRCIRRKQ